MFRSTVSLMVLLGIFAIGVRWFAIERASDRFESDPDAYRLLAETWAKSGTFGQPSAEGVLPTAFRPPLYPALLTQVVSADSKKLDTGSLSWVHALLGAGTVTCTSLFFLQASRGTYLEWGTRSLALGTILSGMWVTFDPILIRQSQLIMTETLATFLMVFLLLLLVLVAWASRPKEPSLLRARRPGHGEETPVFSGRSAFLCSLFGLGIGLVVGFNALCRPSGIAWLGVFLLGSAGIAIAMRLARGPGVSPGAAFATPGETPGPR